MNDKISVIIPIYNNEQYLKRCLDSVIYQTYKNLEIILVDDGSTDNSGKICDDYALKDDRIKILHLKNGGPSYARNKGLEIVTGEYIGFVDSDDYIDVTMFESLLLNQKEYDADIACCNVVLVEKKLNYLKPKIPNGIVEKDLSVSLGVFELSFGTFLCNKIFKKKMFNSFKLKEGFFYEDYEAVTRLLILSAKTVYIDKNLYFYNLSNWESTTNQFNLKVQTDSFEMAKEVYLLCKKENLPKSTYLSLIRFFDSGIDLIRLFYFYKIEEEYFVKIKEIKNLITKNFKSFCFSKIMLKKKILIVIFLINPNCLKYLRKFLVKQKYLRS
jgi:glycosyltransferase involved in cell wall biosynthesis